MQRVTDNPSECPGTLRPIAQLTADSSANTTRIDEWVRTTGTVLSHASACRRAVWTVCLRMHGLRVHALRQIKARYQPASTGDGGRRETALFESHGVAVRRGSRSRSRSDPSENGSRARPCNLPPQPGSTRPLPTPSKGHSSGCLICTRSALS